MAQMSLADLLQHRQPDWRPQSGSEWMDRVAPQIQQTPMPNIYPESPLVPQDKFDYGSAAGRVLDPRDVAHAQANPPNFASEHGVDDLPGYIDVPQPSLGGMLQRRFAPQPQPRRELYPWWGWRQTPQSRGR